jgi:hypothetical protein
MKRWIHIVLFSLSLSVLPVALPDAQAQCPMCRMSAESNLKNGGTEGKGLNKGILFMLAMPYLLVGVIGYAWYRNNQNQKDKE